MGWETPEAFWREGAEEEYPQEWGHGSLKGYATVLPRRINGLRRGFRREDRSGAEEAEKGSGWGRGLVHGQPLGCWRGKNVESGAPYDRDFLKPFESQAKSVKLDAAGHEAVQLKSIAADGK
jgi:hypothetical protein